MRADVCDVRDPKLIWRIYVKLPVQGVIGHDSRAATVRARPFFVTNLGPYARHTGQTPRSVGADVFADIAQIIMQFAISVDLTTFAPSLLQQRGLALILQRTMA